MKIIRFENPPISFSPSILFIEKQDDVFYKIYANGLHIGYIITKQNEWAFQTENHTLTNEDKEFLIEAAKQL